MNKFMQNVQSFVHSITTTDRYASYDSQYRNSPNSRPRADPNDMFDQSREEARLGGDIDGHDLGVERGTGADTDADGFTSVRFLRRSQSSSSLNSPNSGVYGYRAGPNDSQTSLNGLRGSSNNSPRPSYTPGMRSSQMGNGQANGSIAMQDYNDGMPPPPAPALSWKRIDRWMEANYPELFDQISDPVSSADLNELESDLDCTLPLDVRDSYMIHDGQEAGGKPTGLIFGITFLDLECIADEWTQWKNTAIKLNNMVRQQEYLRRQGAGPQGVSGSRASGSTSPRLKSPNPTSGPSGPSSPGANRRPMPPGYRGNSLNQWIRHQESVPDRAIQLVYAHPGWIPLAKDFEGNNIAVDLAPGKNGRWGQIILFGREFDRKYVVAPSWAAFLSTFADDLESGDHYIDDDLEDAHFMFQMPHSRPMSYFDVLKGRVERSMRQIYQASGKRPVGAPANGSAVGTANGTANMIYSPPPSVSGASISKFPSKKLSYENSPTSSTRVSESMDETLLVSTSDSTSTNHNKPETTTDTTNDKINDTAAALAATDLSSHGPADQADLHESSHTNSTVNSPEVPSSGAHENENVNGKDEGKDDKESEAKTSISQETDVDLDDAATLKDSQAPRTDTSAKDADADADTKTPPATEQLAEVEL